MQKLQAHVFFTFFFGTRYISIFIMEWIRTARCVNSNAYSMERKEETREDSFVVFTLESTTIIVDLVIKWLICISLNYVHHLFCFTLYYNVHLYYNHSFKKFCKLKWHILIKIAKTTVSRQKLQWNIAESGVKHNKSNQIKFIVISAIEIINLIWFDLLCLTPLSEIFQLYYGDQL